jgi:GR25 family glycosyltransferase involved in LPS biosynthesis
VFVINLKDRHDKLDAVQLAASLTGIHVDVIEGVRGADISNKALPPKGVPDQEHRHEAGFNNIAGCWRSHISFAQRIVSENLGSGLVMEDDADWSVYIKDQLELVAAGSQYISSTPVDSVPASPYGDDWDLLWLGHCGSDFGEPGTRRLVIENDATVPPPQHRVNNNVPDFSAAGYDNTTRVVYRAGGGLCTQAYALSLRGARKVLARFTTILDFQPIDHALHWMCHDRILDFKCVGVFPQLWASHRAAGHYNRDSDIQSLDNRGKEIREQAMTFNIVHSVRLNAARILVNGTAAVTSQWDDVPVLPGGVRVRYE